jgi:hypothetical protein
MRKVIESTLVSLDGVLENPHPSKFVCHLEHKIIEVPRWTCSLKEVTRKKMCVVRVERNVSICFPFHLE